MELSSVSSKRRLGSRRTQEREYQNMHRRITEQRKQLDRLQQVLGQLRKSGWESQKTLMQMRRDSERRMRKQLIPPPPSSRLGGNKPALVFREH